MIYELRQKYAVSRLLKIANLPRSSYYYYVSQSQKGDKYQETKAKIKEIYEYHKGRYGYRRVTLELHNQGFVINHKTVQRLMQELNLFSRVRIKKYRSYRGEVGKAAPNLLERDFYAQHPYEKWVTDVTQIEIFGKKAYLSPIIDLYNGEVISYDLSLHPDFSQTMRMLDSALAKLPKEHRLIIHSDQGWQYRMKKYQDRLNEKGIRQSMSRKGNCLDNAVAENFFSLLKSELLYITKFNSVEELTDELTKYIEYYNHVRIKLRLRTSPVQFRLKNAG